MTVSKLFSHNGDKWETSRVNALFQLEVAKHILAIPLLRHKSGDRCIWKHTWNEVYSVKTGYHLACQSRVHSCSLTESSVGEDPVWKWIHSLRTLPKIFHFLWKCARGALPVAVELKKRHIDVDEICKQCGE
ncbi:hypothetical protein C2S53_010271, partial [Perilla frutescens var. hirtella]